MSESAIRDVLTSHQEWIERERAKQVPRLDLDPSEISQRDARRTARELITMVAEEEATEMAITYQRIAIRDQRTRWGSCSAQGTLSFNWRLVLAPYDVLDYVVVHELCHIREPNHSPRFWALVADRRPNWREHRAWLREYGSELLAFRPGH